MSKNKESSVFCPFCNTYAGLADYKYGSPLRTCKKCKKQYLDTTYHEIAFEGIRESDINPTEEQLAQMVKDNRKYGRNALLLGIAALGAGVLLLFLGWLGLLGFIVSVILIAVGIYNMRLSGSSLLEKKRTEIEAEKKASFQRVTDLQYVETLRNLGYTVPDSFAASQTPVESQEVHFCARCKKQITDEESEWINNHRFCHDCARPIGKNSAEAAEKQEASASEAP